MESFLKTSFRNVRSDKRTEKFHKTLLDEVLNIKPEWSEYSWIRQIRDEKTGKIIQPEYKIDPDAMNGNFKVDLAGLKDGELKIVILAKSNNSSINKNNKS